MLGGSRARGAEQPDSDVDLGLYYRHPLDVQELQTLAETLAEARSGVERPTVTEPGGWGPWVDGGGWLSMDDIAVDWIYRDLDRVQASATLAESGRFSFHFQIGHPLGIPDFAYAGEVALGILLADPTGELTRLKGRLATYPPALTQAVMDRLSEAYFLLGGLEKSAKRADVVLVAGSLFRVIGLCAHAVHAKAGEWVISEKGLVEAAGRLPTAPPRFSVRAEMILVLTIVATHLVVVVLAAPHGLVVLALALLARQVATFPLRQVVLHRVVGAPYRCLVRPLRVLLAAVAMGAVIVLGTTVLPVETRDARLLFAVLAAAVSYPLLLAATSWSVLRELVGDLDLLAKVRRRRPAAS